MKEPVDVSRAIEIRSLREGGDSPWGRIQALQCWAPGIYQVHTASHGGFKLATSRQIQIPPAMRRDDGWYEEDCEAALVIVSFPEVFGEERVAMGHQTIAQYYPELVEVAGS